MKTGWMVMLAALGCAACSSDGDDDPGSGTAIADGPLAGVVAGKLWSFRSGETDAFLSEGESTYWAEAYAEATTPCSTSFPSLDYLILNVPRQPGSYNLGTTLTATFVIEASNDNLVATRGRMVIDEVSSTTIRGGAFIEYDPQNSVNGHFDLNICP